MPPTMKAPKALPPGYVEEAFEARPLLADVFSILLRARSLGSRKALLEYRTEAEVGKGILEVGIQPFEGSHVRIGHVFHR